MMQSAVSVGIFLVLLACLPFVLKWFKQRTMGVNGEMGGQSRFISALAVGPHQRVVTVEVGPEGRRVWLTLGVTAQAISCLHSVEVDTAPGLGADAADLVAPAIPPMAGTPTT
jgi:flagellar protein FliO/FliZ